MFSVPIVAPIALVLLLVVAAPTVFLLWADVLLGALRLEWAPADVMLDASDLILLPLLLVLVWRARGRLLQLPGRWPWALLGCWTSVGYLVFHPEVQQYFSGPAQIGYQLYRYCWKPILYLPLFLLLVDRRDRLRATLAIVVLAGDLVSLQQAYLGYTTGDRGFGNAFGNWIVVPYVVALWGLVFERRLLPRLFFGASLLLMVRALLFAASRGAWAGVFVATAVLAALLVRLPVARRRVPMLIAGASLLVAVVLVAKPDLFERPNVRAILTLRSAASDHNFVWRLDRWRFFADRVAENPWFGVGHDLDPDWGGAGATPHNSYLSLALLYGVPAAALTVGFAASALVRGLRLWRRSDPWQSSMGVLIVAALSGLLVRSLVEAALIDPFVIKLYWLLCALPTLALLVEPAPASASGREHPRRRKRRRPVFPQPLARRW